MDNPEKKSIIALIQEELAEMKETALRSAAEARNGMHLGSDRTRTRGERGVMNEQAYLIAAQMKQVEQCHDLMRALSELDLSTARRVRPGALIDVEDAGNGGLTTYFMVPGGMGRTLAFGERRINLVSPDSPLGRALLDRRRGNMVELQLPAGSRSLRILGIF